MPRFNTDTEEIAPFDFESNLFTAHSGEKQPFNQMENSHNKNKCRFKLPEEDLKEVQQTLYDYFYKLMVKDFPEEYCVVADEETDTNAILRNSVMSKQRRAHDVYPISDELPLKQAVEQGVVRVEKSEVYRGI